ncbi:MAG: hypothetical protein K0S29_780 [Gammaproteobacteria bacterium]|jgi:hypothetical protein|nr:hypothetical protein [Gammaproteobacteria bacterium]
MKAYKNLFYTVAAFLLLIDLSFAATTSATVNVQIMPAVPSDDNTPAETSTSESSVSTAVYGNISNPAELAPGVKALGAHTSNASVSGSADSSGDSISNVASNSSSKNKANRKIAQAKASGMSFGVINKPSSGSIVVTIDANGARSINQNGAKEGGAVEEGGHSPVSYTISGSAGNTVFLSLPNASPPGPNGINYTLNTGKRNLGTCVVGSGCANRKIGGSVEISSDASMGNAVVQAAISAVST